MTRPTISPPQRSFSQASSSIVSVDPLIVSPVDQTHSPLVASQRANSASSSEYKNMNTSSIVQSGRATPPQHSSHYNHLRPSPTSTSSGERTASSVFTYSSQESNHPLPPLPGEEPLPSPELPEKEPIPSPELPEKEPLPSPPQLEEEPLPSRPPQLEDEPLPSRPPQLEDEPLPSHAPQLEEEPLPSSTLTEEEPLPSPIPASDGSQASHGSSERASALLKPPVSYDTPVEHSTTPPPRPSSQYTDTTQPLPPLPGEHDDDDRPYSLKYAHYHADPSLSNDNTNITSTSTDQQSPQPDSPWYLN